MVYYISMYVYVCECMLHIHMYVSVYVYIIFCLRLRIIEFDLENIKKLLRKQFEKQTFVTATVAALPSAPLCM